MAVYLEIAGLINTEVIGWELPRGSVLRRLPTPLAEKAESPEPTRLHVKPPTADPQKGDWNEWHRKSREIATARVWEEGHGDELWVDVQPAVDPSHPTEWIVVRQEAVPAFLQRMRRGRLVMLNCLTVSCDAIRSKKAPTTEEASLLAAMAALHACLDAPDRGAPATPLEVAEWYLGDGVKSGRAAEICDAWEPFLGHLLNPVGPLVTGARQRINVVRADRLTGRSDARRPLNWALRVADRIEAIDGAYRRAWRQAEREGSGRYAAPDYAITADHLLGEFEAFAIAARKAAAHETVFGSLVESRVAELIARAVAPLTVSSGALAGVSYKQQLDAVIWDHRILPAVMEHGSVAIVPAVCACGILEVKGGSTASPGELGLRVERLRDDLAIQRARSAVESVPVPVLGLMIASKQSYDQVRLESADLVTVLFKKVDDFEYSPNVRGILDLLSFLYDQVLPVSRAMLTSIEGSERIPHY